MYRSTASVTGALFILATAMGVLNAGILGPLIGRPNYPIAMLNPLQPRPVAAVMGRAGKANSYQPPSRARPGEYID
jgi:hypothetical protein